MKDSAVVYDEAYFEQGTLGWGKEGGYSQVRDATHRTFFHIVNHCSPEEVQKFLTSSMGKNVIDVGCAYGYVLELLHSLGYDCYGTDYSEYAISKARTILPSDVQLKVANSQQMAPCDLFGVKFDLAILMEVLEHLPNSYDLLKNIYMSLNPGGWLLITTPNLFLCKLRRDLWGDTIYDEPAHINLKASWVWSGIMKELPWSKIVVRTEGAQFNKYGIRKLLNKTPIGSSVIIWAKK